MIDPKKVFKSVLATLWPGGNQTPSVGPMIGKDVVKPNKNIDILAEATSLASIIAASQGADLAMPIASKGLIITGIGTEEIIGMTTPSATQVSPGDSTPPSTSLNRKGHAIVEVSMIPVMTEANKETYNKNGFFCLRDEENNWFVSIAHRWLSEDIAWNVPDDLPEEYQGLGWWPTWKVEAGRLNATDEQPIFDTRLLPGTTATFRIEWDHGVVLTTLMETGDAIGLNVEEEMGLDKVCTSSECSKFFSMFSPADVTEIEFETEPDEE